MDGYAGETTPTGAFPSYPEAAEIAAYMRAFKGPLSSPSLPDWLERCGAFGRTPCLAYILREIIACGMAERLCSLSRWGAEAAAWGESLALRCGFQPYPVECLLHAYALALRLLPTPDVDATKALGDLNDLSEPLAQYGEPCGLVNPRWDDHLGREERCALIDRLTEVDGANCRTLGVAVASCRCCDTSPGAVTLLVELRRTLPRATATLCCAAYAPSGLLLDASASATLLLTDPLSLPRRLRVPVPPCRLGTLRLFLR